MLHWWCMSGDPLHFVLHNSVILLFILAGSMPLLPPVRAWGEEKLREFRCSHDHGHGPE